MPPTNEAHEGQVLIAADAPPAQPQGSFLSTLPMMLVIFGIFYFLLIRPQNKQREAHQNLLSGLKKGDAVITEGGLVGCILEVRDDRVVLELSSNTRITVMRESIERMDKQGESDSGSDKKKGA